MRRYLNHNDAEPDYLSCDPCATATLPHDVPNSGSLPRNTLLFCEQINPKIVSTLPVASAAPDKVALLEQAQN
jgi:hypothetical protein